MARWETNAEIRAATVAAGFPASVHQLRRWRGMGLLPDVRQVGRGRPTGGSDTRHPLGTAAQAIAIGQLLSDKGRLANVGWKLWLQGFPVREDHWREPLENAHATLRRVSEVVSAAVVRDQRRIGKSVYDLTDLNVLAGTPIYAAITRLPSTLRSAALRVAAEVLLGRFRVNGSAGKPFDPSESKVISAVMGLSADPPKISGQSLNFGELPHILENLSVATNSLIRNSNRIVEPSIRDRLDLLNAQTITIDLYHSTAWLFKGGFNLRTAQRILSGASIQIQAAMLLVWARYSAIDENRESSVAIAEMVQGAAKLRELADQLRRTIAEFPKGHPLGNRTKLRRAISDPKLLTKLVKSAAQFQ